MTLLVHNQNADIVYQAYLYSDALKSSNMVICYFYGLSLRLWDVACADGDCHHPIAAHIPVPDYPIYSAVAVNGGFALGGGRGGRAPTFVGIPLHVVGGLF